MNYASFSISHMNPKPFQTNTCEIGEENKGVKFEITIPKVNKEGKVNYQIS